MTKILVIGLDCAAPELLFGDERLTHFRRLMGNGCYGRLESVIPPITVPAWMCLATSQDPGSLGVYGFRNRADHSYEGLRFANARSIVEPAIWDQVSRQGRPLEHHRRAPVLPPQAGGRHLRRVFPDSRYPPQPSTPIRPSSRSGSPDWWETTRST